MVIFHSYVSVPEGIQIMTQLIYPRVNEMWETSLVFRSENDLQMVGSLPYRTVSLISDLPSGND